MKTKLLIVLITLFLFGNATYSQNAQIGASYTTSFVDKDFDISKVYYKETGSNVSKSEYIKLIQENPKLYLEREIDAEGHVLRYLCDPNNQIKESTFLEGGLEKPL